MKHIENEGSDLLTPIFYTHRVPHGPDEATTPTLPDRDPCPTVHSRRAPQAPASRQHSKLIEAGHRDGAAPMTGPASAKRTMMLGFPAPQRGTPDRFTASREIVGRFVSICGTDPMG